MDSFLKAVASSKTKDYDVLIVAHYLHIHSIIQDEVTCSTTTYGGVDPFLILIFYKKKFLVKFRSVASNNFKIHKSLKSVYLVTMGVFCLDSSIYSSELGSQLELIEITKLGILGTIGSLIQPLSFPSLLVYPLKFGSPSDKMTNDYFQRSIRPVSLYSLELT